MMNVKFFAPYYVFMKDHYLDIISEACITVQELSTLNIFLNMFPIGPFSLLELYKVLCKVHKLPIPTHMQGNLISNRIKHIYNKIETHIIFRLYVKMDKPSISSSSSSFFESIQL